MSGTLRCCQGCGAVEGQPQAGLKTRGIPRARQRVVPVVLIMTPFLDIGMRLLCPNCRAGVSEIRARLIADQRAFVKR